MSAAPRKKAASAPPRAPTAEPDSADLPPGWTLVPLAQLTKTPKQDIVDGPFGSNLKASEYVDQGVPIVRLQNISRNAFLDKNIRCIPERKARELERHSFVSGDLIVTKLGDPVGKACIVPPSLPGGIIVADVVRVRIDENRASKQYAAYAINSPNVASQLSLEVKGSTRPRVNLGHIRNLEIPLPPLAEQRRIVAKLEELLGKVEASRQRLAQVPALLKRFRQAVLAAACSGRLTADWRERQHTALDVSEQLAASVAAVAADFTIAVKQSQHLRLRRPARPTCLGDYGFAWGDSAPTPDNWATVPLGNVCRKITDGTHGTPIPTPTGVPYITARHVRDARIDTENCLFLAQKDHDEIFARCDPEQGDVVLVNIGAGTATPAMVRVSFAFSMKNVALLKPIRTLVIGEYLEFYLLLIKPRVFDEVTRGGAQPFMGLDLIKTIPFVLPPLPEQEEIVRRVEAMFAVADRLEARFEKARAQVDRLAPALLAKAFRGELVPQNPRDQPASALLEQLCGEK